PAAKRTALSKSDWLSFFSFVLSPACFAQNTATPQNHSVAKPQRLRGAPLRPRFIGGTSPLCAPAPLAAHDLRRMNRPMLGFAISKLYYIGRFMSN
ncbi:MAG: hypothetical protein LBL83_13240, partial [Clostridiales bacterium]|nr:hypothetical protein [Clostridiales bacterium]